MFDLTCLIDKNATQENKPNDICWIYHLIDL